MRLVVTFALTLSTGVLVAGGVAIAIGWILPGARVPVFLILSTWWMWIGWKYATLRDRIDRAR